MISPLLEAKSSLQIQSDAFRHEYSPKVNPNTLRKDVESYLGEYRFEVQRYNYELIFGDSSSGEKHLLDVDDREPMVDKAHRALERRIKENKSIIRERAELQGLLDLEKKLQYACLGNTIVWMSPPGPASDGYGNYGYVFTGTVGKINTYTQEKHLSMTAIRIDQPTLDQFNMALTFITGYEFKFDKEEKFLANPVIVEKYWDNLENVLSYTFNTTARSEKDELFRKIVPLLRPQIEEFIALVHQGRSRNLLFRAFQSIELYALDLIEQYSDSGSCTPLSSTDISLQQMVVHYQDQTPPAVAGSCGSSGSSSSGLTSSNLFNKYSSLSELFSQEDYKNDPNLCQCGNPNEAHFHCPGKNETCKHPIIVGEETTQCPSCGLKATCS